MKLTAFLFFLYGIAFSQGIPVNVELHSGLKQQAEFLGMAGDTVRLGGTIQGKFTEVHLLLSAFKEIRDEQGNILPLDSLAAAGNENQTTDTAAADTLNPETVPENSGLETAALEDSAAVKLQENPLPPTLPAKEKATPVKSHFFIDSDPDGAIITKRDSDPICKTPCAFTTFDSSRVTFDIYWKVGNHLWAAHTNLLPIPGDTAKATLKLKRVEPAVEFITFPEGAEIFPPETITKKSKPIGKTPFVYRTLDIGFSEFRLWIPGYRDTLVQLYVTPDEKNIFKTELTALTNSEEIEKQNALIKTRKHYALGLTLMGSSIAPAVAGGILSIAAHQKYDKAKTLKKDLERPASVQGKNYQAKVKENKKRADEGDRYLYSGIACFGIAVLLLGAGISFTF
ncbi:MAG: hypothetical protein LBR60_03500 [Fibrobacter sp.]|jgi:hypothetical protein|nr:hypothetical protein [Fibrobacter sp.]